MEAAEICEAMSIAGCPSKLMKVKQIPHVSKAMRMGGDLCLGQYRADCHYGEHGGEAGWFVSEKKNNESSNMCHLVSPLFSASILRGLQAYD